MTRKSDREILNFASLSLKTFFKKHKLEADEFGPMETFIAMDAFQQEHLVVCSEFKGTYSGRLYVTASRELLQFLFKKIIPGMGDTPPESGIRSLLAEICSTIAGNLRHIMGADIELSLPKPSSVNDLNQAATQNESANICAITIEKQVLNLILDLPANRHL